MARGRFEKVADVRRNGPEKPAALSQGGGLEGGGGFAVAFKENIHLGTRRGRKTLALRGLEKTPAGARACHPPAPGKAAPGEPKLPASRRNAGLRWPVPTAVPETAPKAFPSPQLLPSPTVGEGGGLGSLPAFALKVVFLFPPPFGSVSPRSPAVFAARWRRGAGGKDPERPAGVRLRWASASPRRSSRCGRGSQRGGFVGFSSGGVCTK